MQDLTNTISLSKAAACFRVGGWIPQGRVLVPHPVCTGSRLWAIKIWERTGIIGIQMHGGINAFWNGTARVRLVLRNRVHLGAKQLSLFKVRPPLVMWGRGERTVFKVKNLHCRSRPWLSPLKCLSVCYFNYLRASPTV